MDDEMRHHQTVDRLGQAPNNLFLPVSESMLRDLRAKQAMPWSGVPTFLPTWSKACRDEGGGQGLAWGWYELIAGPTGAGKTILALNQVARALRDNVSCLFFSLEMSCAQLLTRLRAIVSGQEITHLETGRYFRADEAEEADCALMELPGSLYVNTEPIWKLSDIREVMEVHRETDGVRLFVVDYAQLVEPSGSDKKLYEAMASISSQLRHEAKRLGAVCIALSQLNRSSTAGDSRPSVDGLFGSSRFGFDADQVLILDTRREVNEIKRTERRKLLLAKNRHGPTLELPLEFDKSCLRWRELLPDEQASYSNGKIRP